MSLTQNLNVIPFSLTGLNNINASTINGNSIFSGNVLITFTSALTPTLTYDSTTATIILNLPYSSATNSGILSNTNFSIFNNKENALTFSFPLTRVGNTISIPNLTISTNTPSNTYNDFHGYNAGNPSLISGQFNLCFGRLAGGNLTTGQSNICIGYASGNSITTQSNNIFIGPTGFNIGADNNTVVGIGNNFSGVHSNPKTIFGYGNNSNADNQVIIGNGITASNTSAFYVNPVRQDVNGGDFFLCYNSSTKEITYQTMRSRNFSNPPYICASDGSQFGYVLSSNYAGINASNTFASGYTNTFNGITYLNGNNSGGTGISSPSLVMVLNDWKTQVNSWSQGYFIVQYGPNNKCFYYNFGQFANDMYSNVPPPSGTALLSSNNTWTGTNTYSNNITLNAGYTFTFNGYANFYYPVSFNTYQTTFNNGINVASGNIVCGNGYISATNNNWDIGRVSVGDYGYTWIADYGTGDSDNFYIRGSQISVSTTSINYYCDRNAKENIEPYEIKNPFDIINKLNISKFNMKEDRNKTIEYGFIAQDIEEAGLEIAVRTDTVQRLNDKGETIYNKNEDGTDNKNDPLMFEKKSVKTYYITLLHNEAMKILIKENEDLKSRVERLENIILKLVNNT